MICVPIRKKTIHAILKSLKEAEKLADMTEIWFDEMESDLNEENLKKIFKAKKTPLLYKCQNPENLKLIMKFKPEFLDLDLNSPAKFFKNIPSSTKLIISHHDFKKTPKLSELKKIATKMERKGADIIKIATYAKNFSDSLSIMQLINDLNQKGKKTICLAMGKDGKITRSASHILGNYLMYAPLSISEKTADGQIGFKELKKIQELCH